jgi:hypothetical protein
MAKVEIDGEQVEVSPDQIEFGEDDPFVTQEQLNNVVKQRLKRERQKMPERLREDKDFVQSILDEHSDGSSPDNEERSLKSKLEAEIERREKLESELQSTRTETLRQTLINEASGIEKEMEDVLVAYAQDDFVYDDDIGWAQKGEDGGVRFDGGEPVTPGRYVKQLRKEKPSFFGSRANGPDLSGSQESTGQNRYTESQWESKMENPEDLSDEEFNELVQAYEEGRVG